MQIPQNVVNWLLEEENPSICYRTMKELLDMPESDPRVQRAKKKIPSYSPVKKMLDAMHPDGYWEEINPRTKEKIGDGTIYFRNTTHFILAYLAELGMTRENPTIEKAVNRYLSLQQPNGDFYRQFSCLYAMNIRTFVLLGFRDDERVKNTIRLMRESIRYDNGYLCDMHEGKHKKGRLVKSCIRGSAKVLFAVSELPDLWEEPLSKKVVDYFLDRNVLYKSTDKSSLVNRDAGQTIFPFTWRFGLLDILLPLSKMGYIKEPRMQSAWDFLENHKNQKDQYILDIDIKCKYWKVGKRGESNKWVTFYAYLCLKYK